MSRLACPALKKCPGCNEIQFVGNFYERKSTKRSYIDALGLSRVSRCKTCAAQKYQDLDHRKKLLNNAKKRAKNKGVPCSLSPQDIVIPKRCPVLGTAMDSSSQAASMVNSTAPSIDRLDPEKGYTKDNIRIISARANSLKSNATPEECIAVACYVAREHNLDPEIINNLEALLKEANASRLENKTSMPRWLTCT
jgi:hypothetical protein